MDDALGIARRRLGEVATWQVLEVRRFFDAKDGDPALKGGAWRSVRAVATGSRAEMLAWLASIEDTTAETDRYGIARAWRCRRADDGAIRYPAIGSFGYDNDGSST